MSAESYRATVGEILDKDRVILALDDMTHRQSVELLQETSGLIGMAKENANAQSAGWNDAVERNLNLGYMLMADAKYHDTPRTMMSHLESTTADGPRFITVHTASDVEALIAAKEGRDKGREKYQHKANSVFEDPLVGSILGITILTSISPERCELIYGMPLKEKVLQLARFAVEAELEGIVCAGSDLKYLNKDPDISKLIKVVPGIVLPGQQKGSGQNRTITPREAMLEGADYLVAGSTVTKAYNKLDATEQFIQQISEGLGV